LTGAGKGWSKDEKGEDRTEDEPKEGWTELI